MRLQGFGDGTTPPLNLGHGRCDTAPRKALGQPFSRIVVGQRLLIDHKYNRDSLRALEEITRVGHGASGEPTPVPGNHDMFETSNRVGLRNQQGRFARPKDHRLCGGLWRQVICVDSHQDQVMVVAERADDARKGAGEAFHMSGSKPAAGSPHFHFQRLRDRDAMLSAFRLRAANQGGHVDEHVAQGAGGLRKVHIEHQRMHVGVQISRDGGDLTCELDRRPGRVGVDWHQDIQFHPTDSTSGVNIARDFSRRADGRGARSGEPVSPGPPRGVEDGLITPLRPGDRRSALPWRPPAEPPHHHRRARP